MTMDDFEALKKRGRSYGAGQLTGRAEQLERKKIRVHCPVISRHVLSQSPTRK